MSLRLGSVPVFVSNQERAVEFYCDKLGFKRTLDIPLDSNVRWLTVAMAANQTELILFHPAMVRNIDERRQLEERIGIWTGAIFLTDDIDDTFLLLKNRGVEFISEPKKQHWGGWEAVFRDPDGNQFCLAQRPENLKHQTRVA
jgi:lactoylglutathione lyase